MQMAYPEESAEYRAARDRCCARRWSCVARWRTWLARGASSRRAGGWPRTTSFQGAGADGSAADVRLSELFEPGRDSMLIYSFMFPRDSGDERPGPAAGETARLPLAETPCP